MNTGRTHLSQSTFKGEAEETGEKQEGENVAHGGERCLNFKVIKLALQKENTSNTPSLSLIQSSHTKDFERWEHSGRNGLDLSSLETQPLTPGV